MLMPSRAPRSRFANRWKVGSDGSRRATEFQLEELEQRCVFSAAGLQWDPSSADSATGAPIASALAGAATHEVLLGYIIPSDRQPQSDGVVNFQATMLAVQDWYGDQM